MKFIVFGVGRMGEALAFDLCRSPGVETVTLADVDPARLEEVASRLPTEKIQKATCNLKDINSIMKLLQGQTVAISAADYMFHESMTKACIEARVHMCDLGGNIHVVAKQRALSKEAEKAGICIVPDCGLAPGMAGLLATYGMKYFDHVDSMKIRVGGLPAHPTAPLHYKMVFSVRGLINEYKEPAEVLRNGQIIHCESLTEIETINFGPPLGTLEAFHTSGGASTLPYTLQDKVKNIDYKTFRYPGHAVILKAMFDLGFFSEKPVAHNNHSIIPREFSEKLLETALTNNDTDVVAVWVEVKGHKNGKESSWRARIFDQHDHTTGHTAMMRTTSYPTAIIAYLLGTGDITSRGVIPGELCVPLDTFVRELQPRGIIVEESHESM